MIDVIVLHETNLPEAMTETSPLRQRRSVALGRLFSLNRQHSKLAMKLHPVAHLLVHVKIVLHRWIVPVL